MCGPDAGRHREAISEFEQAGFDRVYVHQVGTDQDVVLRVLRARGHHSAPAPGGTELTQLVADFLLERLRAWGVHRVFGYPGDGINAIIGAFDRADGDPELIQVRHEEMAALMACGHAKFTGEIGVCLATSGRARSISSTACTTRSSTTRPSSRSSASRPAPRSAAATSRKSTSSRCSRTSPPSTFRWRPSPSRCGTSSTARSASRFRSKRSPVWSSRTTSRRWRPRSHRTSTGPCTPRPGTRGR